ncbi:MAG: MFS transporter [Chloroflexi bacterium]|nr:MFS transporter [Chloroflexota bacterium]
MAAAPPRPRDRARSARLYYGWVVLAATLLIGFVQVASRNPLLSVFLKPMALEYGWSRGEVSLAAGVGFAIAGIVALGVGPLIDRYGPRAFATVGVAVLGVSFAAIAGVSAAWQFYILLAVGRIADSGILELGASVAVSNWFVRRRGRALGLLTLATRLGTAFLPLLAQLFITHVGWRPAWLAIGVTILAVALAPSAWLLRRRPEDMGLAPDGVAASSAVEDRRSTRTETSFSLGQAFRTPALWFLTVANCSAMMVAVALNLHIYPYITDVGLSEGVAIVALTVVALASAGGAVLWGLLVERLHVRWSMSLAMAACALGTVLLIVTRTAEMAYASALVYGLALGGLIGLIPTMWADYFGRESLGAIRGFTFPWVLGLSAIAPAFAGWVYDVGGSYVGAFIPFAGFYLLSALLVAVARPPGMIDSARVRS